MALALGAASGALAQSATVTLTSQKQTIRGYGGISHAAWAGDLTAAERTMAFGNASGQLGFTILRIPVTDGNPDSVNVATAKAAVAAGAIVFASPWNAAGTYGSAQFASYATHLSSFVSYMKNQGVDLYAISVQNEPDYGAQSGWGSWTAAACHDFVVNYGATVGTKLMSCESFNYNKSFYDPILNDSAALANVAIFGTHLYGTAANAYAYPLFDSKGAGKERWMTEHYTDSTTDANSWPNALGVASELHNAMVTGQFNAYVWWYIKRSYGPINNGAITKRGGCMGQWAKFVRPGFHRVDATASPASGLSLSAYKGDSSVVIVVVNTNNASSGLTISIPGATSTSFSKYTTSSGKTLASDGTVSASNGSLSVMLDASSVTSFVGVGSTGTGGTGTGGTTSTGGASATGGTGGAKSTGGTTSTGGVNATGGTTSTGGVNATGGITSTGGASASGGSAGTGGSQPTGGGTALNSGGAPSSSGGSTTGGNVTGGAGNTTQAGGATGVGGSSATGGTLGTGGSLASTGGSSAGNTSAGAKTDDQAPSDTAGCGCRVAGDGSGSKSLALLGVLGTLALGSRRRRR